MGEFKLSDYQNNQCRTSNYVAFERAVCGTQCEQEEFGFSNPIHEPHDTIFFFLCLCLKLFLFHGILLFSVTMLL